MTSFQFGKNDKIYRRWLLFLLTPLAILTGLTLIRPAEGGSLPLGPVIRASVSQEGSQGNSDSAFPSLSHDGRYVAFYSSADNLVPGDSPITAHIFVRDLVANTIVNATVAQSGGFANGSSVFNTQASRTTISQDGRYVTFASDSTNLVPDHSDIYQDIYVRDLVAETNEIVTMSSTGGIVDNQSWDPSISADGRLVAFNSSATNLVNPATSSQQVFLRDLDLNQTILVSVNSSGQVANWACWEGAISANGHYVVFSSDASNLANGDNNGTRDVFIRDLNSNTTNLVSVSLTGTVGNNYSGRPSVSADGRYVVFESGASDLISDDSNNHYDIFVRDTVLNQTYRVSIGLNGSQSNGESGGSNISADGRYIAFHSSATNLVSSPQVPVGNVHCYVHDRITGATSLVSKALDGSPAGQQCWYPNLAGNGSKVSFHSEASTLVANDTNNTTDVFVREFFPPLQIFLPVLLRTVQ
jgi:hypothetical protein